MKLFTIIKKNFKILIRSKSSALIILLGPLLLILLVGTAFNTSALYDIKVGSYSESYNELSDSIIEKLGDEQYRVIKTESEESCKDGVKIGVYHMCVVFPANLEIKEGVENEINVYVDQSRMNLVYAIKGSILSKVSERSLELSEDLTSIVVNQLETASSSLEEKQSLLGELKISNEKFVSAIKDMEEEISMMDDSFNGTDTEMGEILEAVDKIKDTTNDTRYLGDLEDLMELLKNEFSVLKASQKNIKEKISGVKTDLIDSGGKLNEVEAASSKIISNINAIKVKDVESIVSPIKTVARPVTSERTHINYLFPTLIMMVVMFVSLLLSSITVIREKISSAYFRNFISPTGGFLFVFATYLSNILIIILQVGIVLGVMLYLQPHMVNTMLNVSLMVLLITSVFILLGMIVGYVFSSEETATVGAISLGVILLFFSNAIAPLETLPSWIRDITNYNIFVISETILRKLILFEANLDLVLPHIYSLLVYIVVFIVAITVIYKFGTEIYNIKRHLRGR